MKNKWKTIGLASLLLGASILTTVSHVSVSADDNSKNNQVTVQYRYATLNELTASEKKQLIKSLPKTVVEEATYYLVYQPAGLPKTNSVASPLAVFLGLGTLIIAVKVGKSGRKKILYLATLITVAGLVKASAVYAVSTNVLGNYNKDFVLTVGSELPDGKLDISGYEFVGYFVKPLDKAVTQNSSAVIVAPITTTGTTTSTTTGSATTTGATTSTTTGSTTTTGATTSTTTGSTTTTGTTTSTTTSSSTTTGVTTSTTTGSTTTTGTTTSTTTSSSTTTGTTASTTTGLTTTTGATTSTTTSSTTTTGTTTSTTTTTSSTTTTGTTTSTTTGPTTTTGVTTSTTTGSTTTTGTTTSTEINLGIVLEGNTTKAYTVNLAQTNVKSEALQYLYNLRIDMYNNVNPKFNGTDLRSYLSSVGITSAEQYATSFTWDETLERIAIQRALETGVHKQIGHVRTNSSNIYTAKDINSGKGFQGEIIQWGYGVKDALTKSNAFAYGELSALNEADGHYNSENGHLHTLLDPANKSYGFASIADKSFPYGVVTLGVSHSDVSGNTAGGNLNGTYTLNYGID